MLATVCASTQCARVLADGAQPVPITKAPSSSRRRERTATTLRFKILGHPGAMGGGALKRVDDATLCPPSGAGGLRTCCGPSSEAERRGALPRFCSCPVEVRPASSLQPLAKKKACPPRVGMEKNFRNFDPSFWCRQSARGSAFPNRIVRRLRVSSPTLASMYSSHQVVYQCRRRHGERPAHLFKNILWGCGLRRSTLTRWLNWKHKAGRVKFNPSTSRPAPVRTFT